MTSAVTAALPARWRRVRPRHVVDAAQLVALATVLLGVEIGLRTSRVDRVASRLRVRFAAGDQMGPSLDDAPFEPSERRWLRNAARLLRRWPLDATCLRRSLLVGWILRRRDPLLVLGVRSTNGAVDAHAWIRVGERDLDPGAATYVAFDLSPAGRA